MNTQDTILAALRTLAAQDQDNAQELNGVGFSKPDSYRGKQLAQRLFLNEDEAAEALELLRKYSKTQLAHLPLPEAEQAKTEARVVEAKAGRIELGDDGLLRVFFDYNKKHVAAVKTIQAARFRSEGDTKFWAVPLKDGRDLVALFPDFAISPEAQGAIEDYTPPAIEYKGRVVIKESGFLDIHFEYDPVLLARVKTDLPDARFRTEDYKKFWRVPFDHYKILLEKFPDFEMVTEVKRAIVEYEDQQRQVAEADKLVSAKIADALIPDDFFAHQREGVKWLLAHRRSILGDAMGLGKLHSVDTKVLTPSGWREIGTLKIGDRVIGSNGQPTNIIGVFPQGIQDNYRVYFSDGSSVEAGDDHLWTIAFRQGGRKWAELVLTTKELRERGVVHRSWQGRANTTLDLSKMKLYLPMLSAPVEFDKMDELPISPYAMGALIANGYLGGENNPTLSVNALDAQEIERRLTGMDFYIREYGTVTRFVIKGIKSVIETLGLHCLSRDKFIPRNYLQSTIEARIALLHGLMDGDGSISKTNNKITYSTISPKLAADVQELVEGLGGIASVREYDRSSEQKPVEYQVRIRVPVWVKPFSTSRKLQRYNPGRLALPCRTFVKAEFARSVESVCIAVDAPDQLYVTEHCILTHNTRQALVAARAFGLPIMVIAPASLLINWHREAALVDTQVTTHSWAKIPNAPDHDFVLIADEAHYMQSLASSRTKKLLALAESSHCMGLYLLTGTPLKNGRPANLYPLLKAIQHPLAKKKGDYDKRYCDAHATRFTRWDTSGASNLDELHAKTRDAMLRRTKDQALDLPEKLRVMRQAELTPDARQAYQKQFDALKADYERRVAAGEISDSAEALVLLGALRQVTSLAKVDTAIELAGDILDEGGQVVIFVNFKEAGHKIAQGVNGEFLNGDTTKEARQDMVDRFQGGKLKAIICTYGAGGVGITLTAAQTVILVERPWTPGETEQGEDRLHRIGQKSAVTSIWLQYGKADEKIDTILAEKQERIDLVLAGKRKTLRGIGSIKDVAQELLEDIFNEAD